MPFLLRTTRLASARTQTLRPSRQSFIRRSIQTTSAQYSKKDDLMDKDSMETTSTEYSKSGGDANAAHESEAFDPSTTKPETESSQSGSGQAGDSGNSLDASPGNPEISKPAKDADSGLEKSPNEAAGERRQSSGGGSPTKHGGGRSG